MTIPISGKILDEAWAAGQFFKRQRDTHKNDYGHIVIVGGYRGMSGAVRMAGEAALRTGAGLVTIATHPAHADLLQIARPELMSLAADSGDELTAVLARAKVIVCGPGLGRHEWSQTLWKKIHALPVPKLIDADALYFLAAEPKYSPSWILTPHPGEAARLLQISNAELQADRAGAAIAIQKRFGGVCVLKGAQSLIASTEDQLSVCLAGNPGMATAGTGDVLTGIISGLWGQGLAPHTAAKLGVWLHAQAGDLAAKKLGEWSMIASDIINNLPEVISRYVPAH